MSQITVSPTEIAQGATWLQQHGGWGWTLFVAVVVAFGALSVWFYRRKYAPLRAGSAAAGSTVRLLDPDAAIESQGFRFYPNRTRLAQGAPLTELLHGTSEVWAAWYSGPVARNEHLLERGRITRVIVSNPTNVPDTARSDLRLITKEALRCAVPVRWARVPLTNAVMIGDPDALHGWIQIELYVPNLPVGERPTFRIGRREQPRLFLNIKKAYEALWNDSLVPPSSPVS